MGGFGQLDIVRLRDLEVGEHSSLGIQRWCGQHVRATISREDRIEVVVISNGSMHLVGCEEVNETFQCD